MKGKRNQLQLQLQLKLRLTHYTLFLSHTDSTSDGEADCHSQGEQQSKMQRSALDSSFPAKELSSHTKLLYFPFQRKQGPLLEGIESERRSSRPRKANHNVKPDDAGDDVVVDHAASEKAEPQAAVAVRSEGREAC